MEQASHGSFLEACSSALPCAVAGRHRTVRNLGTGLLGLPDPSVLSETIAANSGVGHMMLTAQSNFEVPLVFACLIALAIEGIGMYAIMSWVEVRMTGWAHRSGFNR